MRALMKKKEEGLSQRLIGVLIRWCLYDAGGTCGYSSEPDYTIDPTHKRRKVIIIVSIISC